MPLKRCHLCQQLFSSLADLQQHQAAVHSQIRPTRMYKLCPHCRAKVPSAEFDAHRQSHRPPDIRQTRAWRKLRQQILERDGHRCASCGSPVGLEIHHLKGLDDNRPESLTVLCLDCHRKLHGQSNW